jgi:hypothetical protein
MSLKEELEKITKTSKQEEEISKENQLLKEQLQVFEIKNHDLEEKERKIIIQLEEAERDNEQMKSHLEEKERCYERIEDEWDKLKEKLQSHEEKNHSLEETEKIVISLKLHLEEEKRKEEAMRTQLEEKEEKIEKYEAEITYLREELEKTTTQLNTSLKFEKSTAVLDEILSYQRSPLIKTGLGYENNQKTPEEGTSSKVPKKKEEKKPKIYANILKRPNQTHDQKIHQAFKAEHPGKQINKPEDHHKKDNNKRRNDNQQQTDHSLQEDKDKYRRATPSRRYSIIRYQSIFFGHCFSCTNFGHKEIDCKAYRRNDSLRNRRKIHNDGHAPLHYKVQCYK